MHCPGPCLSVGHWNSINKIYSLKKLQEIVRGPCVVGLEALESLGNFVA